MGWVCYVTLRLECLVTSPMTSPVKVTIRIGLIIRKSFKRRLESTSNCRTSRVVIDELLVRDCRVCLRMVYALASIAIAVNGFGHSSRTLLVDF